MVRRLGLASACLLAAFIATIPAVDQVIFKDGFTLAGTRQTEQESIVDPNNGTSVKLPRANGFDIITTGPKWYIYSNKVQQVGKVLENVRGEDEFKSYKIDFGFKGKTPLPGVGLVKIGEWNKNWVRIIRIDMPEKKQYAEIEQRIHLVTPRVVVMPSANYMWYPFHDTKEIDPNLLKKFILTHPSVAYDAANPDPAKLMLIVEFFKDAGLLDRAEKELADAKAAVTGAWPKEVTERSEKLAAEIRKAKSAVIVTDFEKATRAGQYRTAEELSKRVDDSQLDAVSARVLTTMRAQVETVLPRFEKTRKLLQATIDRVDGGPGSVRGGLFGSAAFLDAVNAGPHAELKAACERILVELHPDSVDKLDFFNSLGEQAQRKIASGQAPGVSAEKLLALAVTGWLKGKNGAEQNVDTALKYWRWRTMLLSYQAEAVLNKRRTLLASTIARNGPLEAGEVAQLIAFLPPPQPEDLARRSGVAVGPGLHRRNTGPLPEGAKGVDYIVRLPKEYAHTKPYRLILMLTQPGVAPEEVTKLLAAEADRHGTIVAAPVWTDSFDGAYDYSGKQHYKALAVLRSVRKHFNIDDDRVFLFGYGEGANFALDCGASHPDHFAGVVAMGANPRSFNMFMNYWRNYQKLPVYVCIGAIAADSFQNTRLFFEKMMPKGYSAIGSIWRGRTMEWFAPEVPIMFDWMEPKKRLTGAATMRLNEPVEPWMTMRQEDNRFYWVGTNQVNPDMTLAVKGRQHFLPAEITADMRQGNFISIKCRGLNSVVIWLDRTLIDWNQPLRITVNGDTPSEWKPRKITPDLEFLLENFFQEGDKGLLYLNKIEIKVRT